MKIFAAVAVLRRSVRLGGLDGSADEDGGRVWERRVWVREGRQQRGGRMDQDRRCAKICRDYFHGLSE
jgi:hypothetical protein